uniref:Cytochrome c biogenesis protein CcsB n=1 Tax=Asparagopsis taxiformis TaxID=260499 RepID=A0A1C9CC72_9FLOR|nr:c-type cytochrome biogenensis protein [Asparagopsis taxiformis]AOM65988.1 c-type cytochrome biogenensis protein [Asparagopsis taxiformis]
MKNLTWNILKKLGNLNFSIFILLLIASISVFGTIIPQDQNLSYYQFNYPVHHSLFNLNWQIIINYNLNHVYTTWWFILLLVIFFTSLIVCTFSRQLPGLKKARKWKFFQQTQSLRRYKNYRILNVKLLSNILYVLNAREYYVFHKKSSIYAYKGLMGRVAPVFVHISIILTLIGSMVGLFGGFMVQEMVPNGEVFHIQNIIKSGFISRLPNLVGKVNYFEIDYNIDNSVKQFFSSISLLDNQGHPLINKVISVNQPLKYKGITLYQTDWQINSLRLRISTDMYIQKKLDKIKIGDTYIWVCDISVSPNMKIFLVVSSLKDKILIYDFNGRLLNALNLNEDIQIGDSFLTVKEIMVSTGLQIKTDPGLYIVYSGFLMLMVSISVSYISYSQIWLNGHGDSIELGGVTNRAELTFEEDIIALQRQYSKYN